MKEDGDIKRGSDFAGALGKTQSLSRETSLIKDHMARNVDLLGVAIKAPASTLVGTITKEDAGFSPIGEFMGCIGVKEWEAEAANGAEESIIRFFVEEFGERRLMLDDRGG